MSRKQRAGRRKHVPQRTCVVCRQTVEKRSLVRIVNTPDEGVIIDPTGKRNGRGAYVCHQPECWQKIKATDVLDRALRIKLSPDDKTRLYEARPL
jgi:predicted RNA-binding protein YlxR (DUF448 family)